MSTVNSQQPEHGYQVFMDIPRPAPQALAPFNAVGVADVVDALEPGALMDLQIRPVAPGLRMIGPALTVLNSRGDTLMLHYAVEICRPGDVLVLVSEDDSPSAVWGKMVTVVAQARGVAGVVVDGHVRDTAHIREVKFPVWSRSVSPRGSTRKGPGSVNVPVMCGGTLVNPGDLIFADDDGIVAIPPERLQEALKAGLARVAREQSIMTSLEQGVSPFELLAMRPAFDAAQLPVNPGPFHK